MSTGAAETSISRNLFWRVSEWISIGLYAVLVYQYVTLWTTPGPESGPRIATLSIMVLFEFVLAHSGIFMAVFPRKLSLFIFVPFYGLFALGFNAAVPGNTILWLYLAVVLMRMRFMFSDPSDEAKFRALGLSMISMFLFLVCIIGSSAFSSTIPEFGLTPAYLQSINYSDIMGATGDGVENPHSMMAAGAVYFTLLALAEIWIYGLLRKSPSNSVKN